jgi:hypothetical protein
VRFWGLLNSFAFVRAIDLIDYRKYTIKGKAFKNSGQRQAENKLPARNKM